MGWFIQVKKLPYHLLLPGVSGLLEVAGRTMQQLLDQGRGHGFQVWGELVQRDAILIERPIERPLFLQIAQGPGDLRPPDLLGLPPEGGDQRHHVHSLPPGSEFVRLLRRDGLGLGDGLIQAQGIGFSHQLQRVDVVELHTVQLGRLTMDLGSRRLVARNRFRNNTNAFTGVDWKWQSELGWDFRAFYVLPVQRLPSERERLFDNDVECGSQRRNAIEVLMPGAPHFVAHAIRNFEVVHWDGFLPLSVHHA